jgi:hypothetical protein
MMQANDEHDVTVVESSVVTTTTTTTIQATKSEEEMSDVPINRLEEGESAAASLPSPEEYRMDRGGSQHASHRDCFLWTVIIATLCVMSLVVGLAVGLTARNNRDDSASAAAMSPQSTSTAARQATVQQVTDYLTAQGVSGLGSSKTHQHKAAVWMAQSDPGNLPIPSGGMDSETGYTYVERYVMALNYWALDGPNWKFSLNFLTEGHVCTWSEILTNGVTYFRSGILCAEPRKVTSLALGKSSAL